MSALTTQVEQHPLIRMLQSSSRLKQSAGIFLAGAATIAIVVSAVTVPLDLKSQFIFAGMTIAFMLLLRSSKSKRITFSLGLLSIVVSTRYIYWRTTSTLHFETLPSAFLGFGLYMAELYAWIILILGYLQTAWPLARKPIPLRGTPSEWPNVDVYIPTYNESLAVVGDTILAAQNMDYPADRMRIYLLDDGRREEFRKFAERVGAQYITRADNKMAKAGNLNNAMRQTDGEYICIFDCDHVPTRAFLQLTLGWMVASRNIALMQTPHFFYSPEPFQRNVPKGRDLPSEGELFYGAVQPGNDFWNAAFFCGSCAILRREALEEMDGFAGDTVTEDAHTALRMQKRGWDTAYLNIPLAAGLATEKLSLHVGQRIRWARGMTQIFRIDNPLFGGKLHWAQRLCYLNAIMHFQFPLPRLVFLTSPLAYLIGGQYVISASAVMILAYAAPHLIHSAATNARLQGKYRHAFWGEVYEVVLTFHLLLPTIVTLFNPRKGKFNVTDKGELLDEGYFDWRLMTPHLIAAGVLAGGIIFGFVKYYFWQNYFDVEMSTLLLNVGWSCFNLILLCAAIAIGLERRQTRKFVRIYTKLPAILMADTGHVFQAETIDISMGGVAVSSSGVNIEAARFTHIELPCGTEKAIFPIDAVDGEKTAFRFRFSPMTLGERRNLVRTIMGRADAWAVRNDHGSESVLKSFWSLIRVDIRLLGTGLRALLRGSSVNTRKKKGKRQEGKLASRIASLVLAAGIGLLLMHGDAHAAALAPAASPAAPSTASSVVTAASGADAAAGSPNRSRDITLTLKDMGAQSPVRLVGVDGEAGFPFTLRKDEVVAAARLTLTLSYSPSMLSDLSHLSVLLNGEPIGAVKLLPEHGGGVTLDIPINPALVLPVNELNLHFVGHYTNDCEDPLHSSLWTIVSNTRSFIHLKLDKLLTLPDLAQLPAPFFDRGDMSALRLPFVFVGNPADGTLEAAAIVASYFGMRASYRGFDFPVVNGIIPQGNAVVFVTGTQSPQGLPLAAAQGPGIAIIPNPNDPAGRLLVVSGRSPEELKAAASTLAAGAVALSGSLATLETPMIANRQPYDAPRWLPSGRSILLGEFTDRVNLQGQGLTPGLLTANFRIAPDIFIWPNSGIPLSVHYRYPNGDWLNEGISRMDVLLNDTYVNSFKLNRSYSFLKIPNLQEGNFTLRQSNVELPPYLIFGQNQLQFFYDMKIKGGGKCESRLPSNVRVGVDLDSSIDLSGVHHFALMPNLAYFAGGGFPFTRMADLSDTLVLLAREPEASEIEAFLNLIGRFGDATGLPAYRVAVRRGADMRDTDKDVLVIGTIDQIMKLDLMSAAPIRRSGSKLRVVVSNPIEQTLGNFIETRAIQERSQADSLLLGGQNLSAFLSFHAPGKMKRTVVVAIAQRSQELPALIESLADRNKNAQIQGDLAIANANGIRSFAVGPKYRVGELPKLTYIRWYLSTQPVLMAFTLLLAVLALGYPLYYLLSLRARRRLREEDKE